MNDYNSWVTSPYISQIVSKKYKEGPNNFETEIYGFWHIMNFLKIQKTAYL